MTSLLSLLYDLAQVKKKLCTLLKVAGSYFRQTNYVISEWCIGLSTHNTRSCILGCIGGIPILVSLLEQG